MQLAPRQLELFRAPPVPPGPTYDPTPLSLPLIAERLALVSPLPPPSKEETTLKAQALAARLATLVGPGFQVLLTVHDNRATMVSYRRQTQVLRVRLHHMFLEAPDAVVQAVVDYAAKGQRRAGETLDDYIARCQEHIRGDARPLVARPARGRCHDLPAIFAELNERWFQGGIRAHVGWGRAHPKRKRRSIRLGVYDHQTRQIRVHPALDRPNVPRFFVEFIVFHEMLHQLFPSGRGRGRHVHHPRAFRDREQAFPRYGAAIAWEKEHLQDLLKR